MHCLKILILGVHAWQKYRAVCSNGNLYETTATGNRDCLIGVQIKKGLPVINKLIQKTTFVEIDELINL